MPVDLTTSLQMLQATTKAGRLRGLMPVIDAKLREGIRHVDIIRFLNEQGFAISEYTYRSYLQRYRKKQTAAGRPPAGHGLTSQMPAVAAAAPLAVGAGARPPSFDYDPHGIPELLK